MHLLSTLFPGTRAPCPPPQAHHPDAMHSVSTCVNGCGRLALHGRGKFCIDCLSGDVPQPCPALIPTDCLTACSLELAARGGVRFTPGGALKAEQADRLWWMVVGA